MCFGVFLDGLLGLNCLLQIEKVNSEDDDSDSGSVLFALFFSFDDSLRVIVACSLRQFARSCAICSEAFRVSS